ncbi:MAG: hypothetical protein U1B30_15905 [Pseudomonadota bacterium]|nr:hypothetical protein [Pseudomonadota bacterium]
MMNLSIQIYPTEASFDSVNFELVAHCSERYDKKGWGEPLLRELEMEGDSSGIGLRKAEHIVKHLTAVNRYIEKLPVRPQTISDIVLVLGKVYRFGEVELLRWKHPDSGLEDDGYTNIHRLAYLAQGAFDNLKPKEEVQSA